MSYKRTEMFMLPQQGAKKIIFTACHSGKLKLAFTSLASPQTSFGVRLSRIHFSPTDVVRGGEMNA